MKRLFLLLFNLYLISSFAQNTQFANIYDVQYGNEHGGQLLIVPDGYIVANIGVCQDIEDGVGCSPIIKIDKSGNLVTYKIFVKHLWRSPYSAIHNVNDTVYICGTDDDTAPAPYKWRVYKCNNNLDSLGGFEKSYFGDKSLVLKGMEIKGDYIYMVGKELLELNATDINFWIVKTDKQGNLIKKRQLDTVAWFEKDNYDVSIAQTADDNFVIAYSSLQDTSSWYYSEGRRHKLMKFDDDLDTLWYHDFGLNTDYFHPIVEIVEGTRDSGLIYTSLISLIDLYEHGEISKDVLNLFGEIQKVIFKLDSNGDVVWSDTMWAKRYTPGTGSGSPVYNITDAHEMRNGDIVIAGQYEDYKKKIYYGLIRRYSADGKLKWEKIYEDENIEGEIAYFYKFQEEENGDLVCAGSIRFDHTVPDESFEWVVRLDSTGCFEPDCGVSDSLQVIHVKSGFITKTKEVISDYTYSEGMILYPNPCKDYIKVKVLKEFHAVSSSIFDIQGRLLVKTSGDKIEEPDISKLNSGIYFLKLTDKYGRSTIGKFIKQ
ncbi:MAG TPA: T9SS type A sorting domain-containing protein [Bacteroidetes bacterium]|nr:T9SS type A sorting domain-containing protein [Bacteroidota bacterium]